MDFNIKKPLHILALLLLCITLFTILVAPVLSFINILPSTQSQQYKELAESITLISEMYILIFQLFIAFFLLILIPIIWYILVNNCSSKEAFNRLKLRLENIDIAFLYGILAAICMYILSFLLVFLLQSMGAKISDLSNIPDIEEMFSPVSMFLLIAVMPVAEEIFFRGFLLDKISSFAGDKFAVFSTAVLFGIAHMSYAKVFPVLFPIIMGLLLAYIVVKTKNLYSSIIAHVTFNIAAFVIYFLGKSLVQALIL
ncbi:MAG: hypothetical protein DRM98_04895 [Thermoplasmata archaeon]|nr:MAG: hypothetical protein DRM98_04895 [Thermoplasmata archaeon]